jgi:two-component system, OmpR family, phosphate regulon sensor histidine kinase PhoR
MRLFWRIYLCLIASALLAFAAAGWHANRSLRRVYQEQVAADLQQQADWAASEIRRFSLKPEANFVDRRCKELGGLSPFRITVVLPDGRVIGDSESDPAGMENHAGRPEIADALAGGIGRAERFSGTVRYPMAYLAVPVERNGEVVAAVRTAMPLANIDRTLRMAYREVALGILAAALLFAALASVFVRRFVRPLEEMRRVAERLADGDLRARIDAPPGGAEMRALSRALNQMAEQLGSRMETITGQRNELKAVLASMSEGVLAVDSDGRVLHFNAAAAGLLDLSDAQTRGRPLEESVRHSELQRTVRLALDSGGEVEREIPLEGDRHLRLHVAPLEDAAGRKIGALVVLSDTTRLQRLEKMRQHFVANVSHELKTPITALRGGVETLLDSDRSDEDRHFIEMMGRQVERLRAIVEDLLSLSRLEHDEQSGRVPLETGRVADVLRRAAANFGKAAEAKRIGVAVDCPEGLVARMNGPLLEQAVGNLIDNAIKYSPEGTRVEVSATATGGGVAIRVKDEGPGIEARHLPRIFERFYRVDQARSRALGGTGLGLAIVKHIAQAHGGSVSVDSQPGKGSAFAVHLRKHPLSGG